MNTAGVGQEERWELPEAEAAGDMSMGGVGSPTWSIRLVKVGFEGAEVSNSGRTWTYLATAFVLAQVQTGGQGVEKVGWPGAGGQGQR